MREKMLAPIHSGENLMEEFLKPLGSVSIIGQGRTMFPACRINEIVHGKRSVSADTA